MASTAEADLGQNCLLAIHLLLYIRQGEDMALKDDTPRLGHGAEKSDLKALTEAVVAIGTDPGG
jgi:hypothetical protein